MSNTDEWATRAARRYAVGDAVTVLDAYRGQGRYAPDGTEGGYWVVGIMTGGNDYKLARHPDDDWTVIVHASRLAPR